MEKQMVEFGGIQILEPGTVISDIILAIASFYFFHILKKVADTKHHKYYSYFFFFLGLSSIIGAFAHGLYLYTGKSLHFITWILTGISVFFVEFASSSYIKEKRMRDFFVFSIKIQFIIYVLLAAYFMNFLTVKINTAVGLLGLVFPIMTYQLFKSGKLENLFIMLGIVFAIFPALIHRNRISIGKIFNMNDLSHFFLIFCLFLIFIGVHRSILREKVDVT